MPPFDPSCCGITFKLLELDRNINVNGIACAGTCIVTDLLLSIDDDENDQISSSSSSGSYVTV
ncbi:hypothetical protein DERF_014624 [Dermatophagoides farinae]|uniref:Uncharacterized protein n=1 Tax=Dermatophagoides farinae TaxID=6954 RepID=A0A922HMP8_DERFA|nr:hypothetical protein DERF_014624 [Dermatophagoides farinae]